MSGGALITWPTVLVILLFLCLDYLVSCQAWPRNESSATSIYAHLDLSFSASYCLLLKMLCFHSVLVFNSIFRPFMSKMHLPTSSDSVQIMLLSS